MTKSRPSHEGRGLKSPPLAGRGRQIMSSLARGTWIEIFFSGDTTYPLMRRPSHEGRGLKSFWSRDQVKRMGRPSHEGRGLKSRSPSSPRSWGSSRPSHEGRGLKSNTDLRMIDKPRVVPRTRDVDLNGNNPATIVTGKGRPSHEGRGLK